MMQVGRFQVFSVVNGHARLDGGAMFGVVPRVLWEKKKPPDEQNRILLALRTLVAFDREAERLILVDTGAGSKWSAEDAERYAVEHDPQALADALRPLGLTEADVTDVVISHLHFDHAGGMTVWKDRPGGELTARFPQARHWVHAEHLAHARHPSPRDRASFFPHDFEPLDVLGLLEPVEGKTPPPPFEGVRWLVSNGHTPSQLLPLFEDDRAPLLFVGDMIPTAAHLPPAWVMSYDLHPVTAVEERQRVLRQCAEDHWRLAFPHDSETGGICVDLSTGRPKVAQTLDLSPPAAG